jgi:hypothetical protein
MEETSRDKRHAHTVRIQQQWIDSYSSYKMIKSRRGTALIDSLFSCRSVVTLNSFDLWPQFSLLYQPLTMNKHGALVK